MLYAIARHLVVGHDSALENLLSVGAIALIFICAPSSSLCRPLVPTCRTAIRHRIFLQSRAASRQRFYLRLKERAKAEVAEAIRFRRDF